MHTFRNADDQNEWLCLTTTVSDLHAALETMMQMEAPSHSILEIAAIRIELLADAAELATPPPPDTEVTQSDRFMFDAMRNALRTTFEAEPDPEVAASIRPLYERIEAASLRLHAAEGLFPRKILPLSGEYA